MPTWIAAARLRNQLLSESHLRRPEDVVGWLGAVQAQEYAPARWALGQRVAAAAVDDADVQRAFDAGRILRTHVMRPTWHFVLPADIRWMLELTAPRVLKAFAPYARRLGLDTRMLTRATAVIERALGDGAALTRIELGERLARARLPMTAAQMGQLAMYAEQEAVVCSGPRRGSRFTYALLAHRAARARRLSRDEALAELTRRFFRSHGPATVRDFVWWSSLATGDARRGLEIIRARRREDGGKVYWSVDGDRSPADTAAGAHLLPIYDEFVVAYRDRDASVPRSIFSNMLSLAGRVAGTWRASAAGGRVVVDIDVAGTLRRSDRAAIDAAVARYSRFLDAPVDLRVIKSFELSARPSASASPARGRRRGSPRDPSAR